MGRGIVPEGGQQPMGPPEDEVLGLKDKYIDISIYFKSILKKCDLNNTVNL